MVEIKEQIQNYDAESDKTTKTNLQHFEAKIQITAKRKKLQMEKK